MSYRQSTLRIKNANSQVSPRVSSQKDYVSEQSGVKRHQFQSVAWGTPGTMLAGEYIGFDLAYFARSKSGATDDVPLSPTASNNYQSPAVFNGGKIRNFNAVIRLKNRGAIGGYLDVYEVAVSFWDVLVWNTIFPTACPFTFDSTTVGPADKRGAIARKAITTTLVVENTIKNYKFLQHYMHKRGTLFLTNEDGGNGGEATFTVNRVPPKCRRSQTGMYWGIILHNDADKNGSETLTLDATIEESFEEVPSENRLPYIS